MKTTNQRKRKKEKNGKERRKEKKEKILHSYNHWETNIDYTLRIEFLSNIISLTHNYTLTRMFLSVEL